MVDDKWMNVRLRKNVQVACNFCIRFSSHTEQISHATNGETRWHKTKESAQSTVVAVSKRLVSRRRDSLKNSFILPDNNYTDRNAAHQSVNQPIIQTGSTRLEEGFESGNRRSFCGPAKWNTNVDHRWGWLGRGQYAQVCIYPKSRFNNGRLSPPLHWIEISYNIPKSISR